MKKFRQHIEESKSAIKSVKDLAKNFSWVKASDDRTGSFWVNPKKLREFQQYLEGLGYKVDRLDDGDIDFTKAGSKRIEVRMDDARTKAAIYLM